MMGLTAFTAQSANDSQWVEADSAKAIAGRIERDFSLTLDEARAQIKSVYPGITDAHIDSCLAAGYIETRVMDNGETRVFRKSPRNLGLIDPQIRDAQKAWTGRGSKAAYARRATAAYNIGRSTGDGTPVNPQRVTITFTLTVPFNEALAGDSVRVWMPYPLETVRQSNIQLLKTSQPDYYISSGNPDESVHRTMYMAAPMTDSDLTFSYTFSYDVAAQYFSPDYIESNLRPYNTNSELYRRFTSLDDVHIANLGALAREIVGSETNPYRQSEMVFDFINRHYPWAGAREYSTIENIPQYVLDHGYGDCGQVSLLYISLMRSLGVPARWESGWMIHPGEKNFHDWAEVYFEGVGWVPVDNSFGRMSADPNQAVTRFHSTGQDNYRLATNCGVGGKLSPAKRFVRSETVDFQAGEVETSKGNLFYPLWDSTLTIESNTPLD
ncbi:MAG: transglutaminase domain-containing protein [Muribaculaceae bacterium]|nr:transglutaminase domain-containing protein [Muribaculaceae bacterium]